jgi:hypothetical protein
MGLFRGNINLHLGLYLLLKICPAMTPATLDHPLIPRTTLLVPFQGVLPASQTAMRGPPTNTPAMHTWVKAYRSLVSVETAITTNPTSPIANPRTVCKDRSRKRSLEYTMTRRPATPL